VTRPAATPFVTEVSMKSRLPAGAVLSEQLGHAVKSGYVRWPAPAFVIARSISCARQVAAKALTEVGPAAVADVLLGGGAPAVADAPRHGLSPRLVRTTAGIAPYPPIGPPPPGPGCQIDHDLVEVAGELPLSVVDPHAGVDPGWACCGHSHVGSPALAALNRTVEYRGADDVLPGHVW
jgi:hypothetical protein